MTSLKPWSDSDVTLRRGVKVTLKAWSDNDITLRRGVTVTSLEPVE